MNRPGQRARGSWSTGVFHRIIFNLTIRVQVLKMLSVVVIKVKIDPDQL